MIKNSYLRLSYAYKKILKTFHEINAKITGKAFSCRTLNGNSKYYNLSVNSDLSVSCNCSDIYGEGIIGNLSDQSLKQIFFGKKANDFRAKLKKGNLPIINCATCYDLATKTIKKITLPSSLLLENTINCNLSCLGCYRENIILHRNKKTMSLDDIKRISKELKNIKVLYYYNQGEPFLSKNIKEELQIIRKDNPKIKIIISTNGLLLNTKEKRQAAMMADEIIFSIHGSTQRSLHKYQIKGNFKKAYSNMKNLAKTRASNKPIITWKYVLFWWNDSKKLIKNTVKLGKEANIDQIMFVLTTWPLYGMAFKHYLRLGYLNRISKFKNGHCLIKFNKS